MLLGLESPSTNPSSDPTWSTATNWPRTAIRTAVARASGLASQRCVFVQDASQHLPRVKTADLASGTLFGSSEGTDDRYDFER
jgi:hypothetical protein